jgi:hypothetical protein
MFCRGAFLFTYNIPFNRFFLVRILKFGEYAYNKYKIQLIFII